MFAGLDGQEADEGNLHAPQRSKRIPCRVADVKTSAVASHADEDESVEGEETSNKGIASPRSYHVAVEQSAQRTPQHRSKLKGLDPEVEGIDQKENSDSLVVVATSHGPRNVARRDAHECRCQQTS